MELRSSEKFIKKFNDRKTVKWTLWKEIAQELNKKGFNVDAVKCRQKFLNLTKAYVAFVRHCNKTGNNKVNTPPFYDLLHNILGNKDKVLLNNISDSMPFNANSTEIVDVSDDNLDQEQSRDVEGLPKTMSADKVTSNSNKKSSVKSVTKSDIIKTIVECNNKIVSAHKENMDKIMSVLTEQNEIMKSEMKQNQDQREQLIHVFQELIRSKNKKKRKRASSSESD